MPSLKDIGQLIQVPIDQVELVEEPQMPPYQITALSDKLQVPDLRNWVPVIVQEPTPRHYRVISNGHIWAAMKAAGQNYIWVAVISDEPEAVEQVKLLSGQLPLKINICTANYDMLLEGLHYLRQIPSYKLDKLDHTLIAQRIVQASGRLAWASLQPLLQLKCNLKSSHLKALESVFEAMPQPIEIHPVVLNTASADELVTALRMAVFLPEINLAEIDLIKLAHSITHEPMRKYWQDLQPLTKLGCGITAGKLKGLDQILKVEPAPPPEIEPVILNTASEDELLATLKLAATFLPETNLAKVDLAKLSRSIVAQSDRKYWKDLKPLAKLGYKPKGLDQVLRIEPALPPTINNVPYLLEQMSLKALQKEAKARGIVCSPKPTKAELVELLTQK